MNTLFCFGYGFSARALARVLQPQGWSIIGTARSKAKVEEMKAAGIEAYQFSTGGQGRGKSPENPYSGALGDDLHAALAGDDLRAALARATHLLISAGPDKDGDPALAVFGDAIRKRAAQFNWVGYLSTTGVYGNHNGDWVDETTPLNPSTERGQRRMMAEAQWQNIPAAVHIFRLAGIYGPGRGPFAKVRNGTARRIIKPDQVFSRIHVDDIARTLMASIQRPNSGAVYNVCDDDPAPPQDVIAYAAHLLGMNVPPQEDYQTAPMTDMARSFYAENKRVRNDKIKCELGVKLRYCDYKSGLKALLAHEQKHKHSPQNALD